MHAYIHTQSYVPVYIYIHVCTYLHVHAGQNVLVNLFNMQDAYVQHLPRHLHVRKHVHRYIYACTYRHKHDMHTHIHMRKHAYILQTHRRSNARTRTFEDMNVLADLQVQMLAHVHNSYLRNTHTHIDMHIHIHIHTYMHTPRQTHKYICTSIYPSIHPSIHPSSDPRMHTQTHTRVHVGLCVQVKILRNLSFYLVIPLACANTHLSLFRSVYFRTG